MLKVGDIVWIKDGNNYGRSTLPFKPILVRVTSVYNDDPKSDFDACPVDKNLYQLSYCYSPSEIFNPAPTRKGNFIGGHQVCQV